MMDAVDTSRPAPAGRAVWALVISASMHAALLLSAAGKPDGGVIMNTAIQLPATAPSVLQVMFQQAGVVVDLVSDMPETSTPAPDEATPALITGSEPVAGRDGLLPLGSSPRYYLTNELDTRPQIRTRVDPVYPKAAAEQGLTAAFTLRVFIDERGRVENVVVPGKNAADPFVAAVVAAFGSASYTPGLKDGVPVKSLLLIEVNFETLDVAESFRGKAY